MTWLTGTTSAVTKLGGRCFESYRQRMVGNSNAELILFWRGVMLEMLGRNSCYIYHRTFMLYDGKLKKLC